MQYGMHMVFSCTVQNLYNRVSASQFMMDMEVVSLHSLLQRSYMVTLRKCLRKFRRMEIRKRMLKMCV